MQIELNTTYRKYKESAHISLIGHRISQPSLEISPIWTVFITADVIKKIKLRPVQIKHDFFYVNSLQRIYLSSDDTYPNTTLVLGLTYVDLSMF
jgi:hypothetical protein